MSACNEMYLCVSIKQAECQGFGEDQLFPGEEGVAEYDSFLEESAGRLLGPLAGLAGGQMFLSNLDSVLPTLLKKLVSVVVCLVNCLVI